jgi:hypothetical protein
MSLALPDIDREFACQVAAFIEEYRPALELSGAATKSLTLAQVRFLHARLIEETGRSESVSLSWGGRIAARGRDARAPGTWFDTSARC